MDKTSSPQQQDAASVKQAQWRLVTELFDQCLGRTPEQQEELLAAAGDALASEVRSLLQHADPDCDPFQSAVDEILNPRQDLPQQIGAYRVERLLGQGGMGTVFLARRIGEFDQRVAVKLIRRDFGTATQALERRFRQERQILASLQHPNIAHLIDGGTSDGRPFLVVEYVEGVRIDDYCDQHHLSIRQRIELFLKVCAAAQYAHQNLIVHRDLKPANVLVLEDGTPKLLDFGIAKLLRDDDSHPDLTRTAVRLFTPSYASPEQLLGGAVGTASDVYSLGIMLYELLTGQKPHVFETDSDFAVVEAIFHQAPTTASNALRRYSEKEKEERAADRTTAYEAWYRTLHGDLDLILSRAISADVTRRYSSIEQFSSDLSRYLMSLPISVRKDSWSYRALKFYGRHKAMTSVTSLALLLLLATGVALWHQYRVAIQQRQRAERRYSDLRSLARSNMTEVQDALDRVKGGTEARALILGRALQYLDRLAAEGDNDIDLQRELAAAYVLLAQRLGNPASANLGDAAGASVAYERSVRIGESIVALSQANQEDRFQLLSARYGKAMMQYSAGQLEAARHTLALATSENDTILAANPRNMKALALSFLLHRELSAILMGNGADAGLANPAEALRQADIALQAAEEAHALQPKSLKYLRNLTIARTTKAEALFDSGSEAEGIQLQKENMTIANASSELLQAQDTQGLIYGNYQYGRMLSKKDPRSALPWVDGALAAVVSARASDKANVKMAQWLAIGTTMAGNLHRRAGETRKGLAMMAEGVAQLEKLMTGTPADVTEIRYSLAAGYQGLGDAALETGHSLQALSEYENAERVYAQEAVGMPDDLEVYQERSANQRNIATVEGKLGMKKEASASRLLAIQYADRVLRIHPGNSIAQDLRLKAVALRE